MKGLIVSDIDGTLLPENAPPVLPDEFYRELHRLQGEGWIFCPASGRQYNSLRSLFAPVADSLAYMCENGAVVFGADGGVLGKTTMPRAQAEELIRDVLATDGCEVTISGEKMCYVLPKKLDMVSIMSNKYGYLATALPSLDDVPEDIIKISVYAPAGAETIPKALSEKWACFHPALAGIPWLDFTVADKGTGLTILCKALGIPPEKVVAFGDNYNDVPMLTLAGRPYLMASAAPALRERFPVHCTSVMDVLRTM